MRLANAVVCAALLTTAVTAMRQLPRPGFVAWGVSAALTPMLLFVGGTVNSSGMAGSAGVAAWTAALTLSKHDGRGSDGGAVARFGAPMCLLLLVRRDSLLWATALLGAASLLFTVDQLRRLAVRPAVWCWAALCAAAAAAQLLLWTPSNAESFVDGSGESATSVLTGFGATFTPIFQAIGDLGWLDTRLPLFVYMVWFGLGLALVLGALAMGPGRAVLSMTVALVLLLILTTVIGAIRHPYLQGRYLMPLLLGLPIVAGFGLSQRITWRRIPLRASLVWFGALFLMHVLSFGQHLRRYVVGRDGP